MKNFPQFSADKMKFFCHRSRVPEFSLDRSKGGFCCVNIVMNLQCGVEKLNFSLQSTHTQQKLCSFLRMDFPTFSNLPKCPIRWKTNDFWQKRVSLLIQFDIESLFDFWSIFQFCYLSFDIWVAKLRKCLGDWWMKRTFEWKIVGKFKTSRLEFHFNLP